MAFSYHQIVDYEFQFVEYEIDQASPLWFLRITGAGQVMSCGPLISRTMFSALECLQGIKRYAQNWPP